MVDLVRAALSAYDVPDGTVVRLIRVLNNAVHEVVLPDGSRYALRVHRTAHRSVEQTRSELLFVREVRDRLEGTGITVPLSIPTRAGDLVVALPDRQHADLTTWVEGAPLRPDTGLDVDATTQLGAALAHVHRTSDEFQPPLDFQLPRWDADGMFSWAAAFGLVELDELIPAQDKALFDDIIERTRLVLDRLRQRGDRLQVVHFDFILGNCHLRRSDAGWHVGVLDFDDCGWGYPLYDLSPLLGNLADFSDSYPTLSKAFLDGYRGVRELSAEDEADLPLLMAARHASMCFKIAGMDRTGGNSPAAAEHIAQRMQLARECLATGS